MSVRQTIFIAVNQGFASRYLLRTDIFGELKKSGARLVILSPNGDEDYFKKEFEDETVTVERMEVEAYEAYNANRVQRFLRNVRLHTTNGATDTHTVDMRYNILRTNRPNSTLFRKLHNVAFDALVFVLRRSRLLRRLEISVESRLFTPSVHRYLFEKYRPDKLLITSLGIFGFDHFLIREAKSHGAKVIAVILSWDNTSSKGMGGAHADHAVAWSETMRRELITYYDFDAANIFVGGVAHFDYHFRAQDTWPKEKLCQRFGLDPERRIIFYALKSPNKYPWNPDIVEMLAKAAEEDRFVRPCQILVRPHPIAYKTVDGKYRFGEEIERHRQVEAKYRHVAYDYPEILSRRLPFDMPKSEMVKVSSILKHSDVMLSYFSTMMLEGSIFDLPSVNVALHSHTNQLEQADLQIVDAPHIKRIIETGGVRSARTYEELVDTVNLYLSDRNLDCMGREIIRDREAGVNAGQAGKAIGQHIIEL